VKKETLRLSRIDQDDNVLLYGIVSSDSELQVCRAINTVFGISLSLTDDIVISGKTSPVIYRKYYFENEENSEKFILIGNRNQTNYLLPELKKIDYIFLIISESSASDFLNSFQLLKANPGISAVFILDPASVKSFHRIQF
jgi:hypothetical protein